MCPALIKKMQSVFAPHTLCIKFITHTMSTSLGEIAIKLYDQLLTYDPARVREVLASPELGDALTVFLRVFEGAKAVAAEGGGLFAWPSAASDLMLPELQELPLKAAFYGQLVDVFEAAEDSRFKAWYVFQHGICAVERAEPDGFKCVFASAIEITCVGRTNKRIFVYHKSNATMSCLLVNSDSKLVEVDHVIELDPRFPVLALSGNENFDSEILHAVVSIGSAMFVAQTFRFDTETFRYVPDAILCRGTSDDLLDVVGLHRTLPKDIKLVNGGSCIIFKGCGNPRKNSPEYSLFQARCIDGAYSLAREVLRGVTDPLKFVVRGNRLIVSFSNHGVPTRFRLDFA
jgi:hypothetical protein